MAHFTDSSGTTYVDTAFLNAAGKIPGVSLQHMGFGEFFADTPKGRVDFDQMRGKDFPGQSGRSHKLTGKGAAWLLSKMERGGHSKAVNDGPQVNDVVTLPNGVEGLVEEVYGNGSVWLWTHAGSSKVDGRRLKVTDHARNPRRWKQEQHALQERRLRDQRERLDRERKEHLPGIMENLRSVEPRRAALRLAAALPKGSDERKALLTMLREAQETHAAIEGVMKEAAANHPLQPGDILYSSWGYDQTNVDFYEVIGITKSMATIQMVEKRILPGSGRGSDSVVPVPGTVHRRAKLLRKKVRPDGSVKISSYANAYPWDGKPKHQTSAGYGH